MNERCERLVLVPVRLVKFVVVVFRPFRAHTVVAVFVAPVMPFGRFSVHVFRRDKGQQHLLRVFKGRVVSGPLVREGAHSQAKGQNSEQSGDLSEFHQPL